jgi:hypothetical protein
MAIAWIRFHNTGTTRMGASACEIEQPSCRHNRRRLTSSLWTVLEVSLPHWPSHYLSTEIPHLHLQRFVSRTSAQIESNFSLVILVSLFLDLYMSATTNSRSLIPAHTIVIREEAGRQGGKMAKSTTQLCLGSFVWQRPATEHSEFWLLAFFSFPFHSDEAGALSRSSPIDYTWCKRA